MTIRLLLVDDHPVVIEGLTRALERHEDVSVVAVARSVAEAREVLAQTPVDVGLVDMRLPDGFGLELVSRSPDRRDRPAWIVLSTYDLAEYVVAAIDRGASGYLLKTAPIADLVDAIRRVAAGGTVFEARHLAAVSAGRVHLSPREREVIAGVLSSRSNDEIAADLHVSRKTIEAYLSRLFDRLEASSRVELALKAEREGWLELPALDRPDR